MRIALALDYAGISVIPLDALLRYNPNRYALMCAVAGSGGSPILSGQIAERDPDAARRFIEHLDHVLTREKNKFRRMENEAHRAPVMSGIARAEAHRILGELE